MASDQRWREMQVCAEAGDVSAVDHYVAEHGVGPGTINMLVHYAARGGQTKLVCFLLDEQHASAASAMDGAVEGVSVDAVDGPHFDIVRLLLDPRPGEDPDDREGRTCDGFLESVHRGNQAFVSLFLGHISPVIFAVGFNTAVRADNLHTMRFLSAHGEVNATAGLQSSNPTAPDDVVCYLIEKGAINWPEHIYTRMGCSPDLVIHLCKFGIPRDLLVCGHEPIRFILDEHARWCAHVRETLDELGVYAVLANLIVQY
jgi:hypothetical protein